MSFSDVDRPSIDLRSTISAGYNPRRSHDGRSSLGTRSPTSPNRRRSPSVAQKRNQTPSDTRSSSGGRRTPFEGRSSIGSDRTSARNDRRKRSASKAPSASVRTNENEASLASESKGKVSPRTVSNNSRKKKDPKLSVHEERTDIERFGEVALLLLKGSSYSADEVLSHINAPDYVVSAKRKGQKLTSENLPTTILTKEGVEQQFDFWFLQIASMDDHIEVRTGLAGGAAANGKGAKQAVTRVSPCISEYVYRIQRLLKFHKHAKQQRQLSASMSMGGGVAAESLGDEEGEEAEAASLAWHLESFRERYSMSAPSEVQSDDEDEDTRAQRIRSRRDADHKATDEDLLDEATRKSHEGTYVGQSLTVGNRSSTEGFGPSDAGVYFVNADVGLGSVLVGTYSSELEEPFDYADVLMGTPNKMKARLRKHMRDNAYGEHLLRHFVQTVGPEPPRERFGARCRRYLLLNHSSLMPEATRMLSEVFHNYLRVLAISFRLILSGVDATVDTIGVPDIVRLAAHPPPCAALARALMEEDQLAKKRLMLTTSLVEISSDNSYARSNKTQLAMRERLKAQQAARDAAEKGLNKTPGGSYEDHFGIKENMSLAQGGFVISSLHTKKTPLENDVNEAEEHISDAYSRIWCIAKLLMNIYWPMSGQGAELRRSRRQMLRRKFQAASLGKNESLTAFYRIAALLETHLNGAPVDESVREPSPLTKQQLTFANFLNIASIIAPAIEVASERLLLLELTKHFGPEAPPPLPTVHACEPYPTIGRLVQFCRLERFYRFHERLHDEADQLLYQQKTTGDDAEYLGARHTRKSLWQLFCRYLYYADDRQTTEPRTEAKRMSDENGELEASYSMREKSPEFGSLEYFEKRFGEMSAKEKAYFNPDNFRKLIERQKRRQRMGISSNVGEEDTGGGFSTLTVAAEEARKERNDQIAVIQVENVGSIFGELKSLKILWQHLYHKYGPEPCSESEVADIHRKAEERTTMLKPERRKLLAFYRFYAPEKTAADVDAALERFGDNIPLMWELLETKYGPVRPVLANDASLGGGGSLVGGDGNVGAIISDEAPQLTQLATIKDILQANGDPNKQLWTVEALIKMITRHVDRENALGVPHVPIVNPFQAITITQSMLDTYLGTEATIIKQRHMLQAYFAEKGFVVSSEDINNLIEYYRYSPMGFEHMWAELVSFYGPEREPIDTENDASRAELEFIKQRKTTNDAEVIGKGLVARKSKVVDTDDHAHWMLEREDVLQSERLENFFDYYTSGGDHFLDSMPQDQLRQKIVNGTPGEGVSRTPSAANNLSPAVDPNPNKFHRRHTHRSKQDLLALQRRFLQGSAGGYELMWRALEAKYGPQPPDAYTRYNMEIKRLKKEAVRRQRANSLAVSKQTAPVEPTPQESAAGNNLANPAQAPLVTQPLPSWAANNHQSHPKGPSNPNAASNSQSSAMVLGSEQRKGELMAMSAYVDPERALRDLQSSVISTKEEEQALIDLFLRWKGTQKKSKTDLGVGLTMGQQVPTMIFEADVKTTGQNLNALLPPNAPQMAHATSSTQQNISQKSKSLYGNALSMSSMRRD